MSVRNLELRSTRAAVNQRVGRPERQREEASIKKVPFAAFLVNRRHGYPLFWLTAVLFFQVTRAHGADVLDRYGGTPSVQCPSGPQAHFYTQKIGNRWWVCDPLGNGFFIKGVVTVLPPANVQTRFGSKTNPYVIATAQDPANVSNFNWSIDAVSHLKSWGFNTLADGAYAMLYPTNKDNRWNTPDQTIPDAYKMPFVTGANTTLYLFNDAFNCGTPLKDMTNGRSPVINSMGIWPYDYGDYFDPNFSRCLAVIIQAHNNELHQLLAAPHNDYLLYATVDEGDQTGGLLGPGPDIASLPTNTTETASYHPGWMALTTKPVQSTSAGAIKVWYNGGTYVDQEIYTKIQFANDVLNRYLCTGPGTPLATCTANQTGTGSIDSASSAYVGAANMTTALNHLNAAWGSKYSTLSTSDSHCASNLGTSGAGCLNSGAYASWGIGTGLLDEDGTCPTRGSSACWMGDPFTLVGESASMQAAMSAFLTDYAVHYFSTQEAQWHNPTYGLPGILLQMQPGGWSAPPRKEVLAIAGQYLGLPELAGIPPNKAVCDATVGGCTNPQTYIDFVAQYMGDKPYMNWEGWPANPDSPMTGSSQWSVYTTQAQRGGPYGPTVTAMANAADTATGSHHVVGFYWWAWQDYTNESTNWGLTTIKGNAYDGKEAVMAVGTDPWGFPTGGEAANYGDFTDLVSAANLGVYAGITGIPNSAPDTLPPSTPALSGNAVSSSQINLTWPAATDNVKVAGYQLYRNGNQIAMLAGNSYQDTGLSAATLYSYTAAAFDTTGNLSPQSAPVRLSTKVDGGGPIDGQYVFSARSTAVITLRPPQGALPGDCEIVSLSPSDDNGAPLSVTAAAGWTPIPVPNTNLGAAGILYLFRHVFASGETNWTFTFSFAQSTLTGGVVSIATGNCQEDIVAGQNTNGAASSSATAPAVTTTGSNEPILVFYQEGYTQTSQSSTLGSWTAPAGTYKVWDDIGINLFWTGSAAYYRMAPTPGSYGPFTATLGAAVKNIGATVALKPLPGGGFELCDVNADGATNVVDVQQAVNAALGTASCTSDINKDGACNVVDVQRVVNAALGGACVSP